MSRIRRLKQHYRLKRRINENLRRYRLLFWRIKVMHFCLWFLHDWRGYTVGDPVNNECDLMIIGLLNWSMSDGRIAPWRFVQHQVQWS